MSRFLEYINPKTFETSFSINTRPIRKKAWIKEKETVVVSQLPSAISGLKREFQDQLWSWNSWKRQKQPMH